MTQILLAPDSFKGSITAAAACDALAAGWREVAGNARLVARPMADGGEGTLDAFAAAVPAAQRMPVVVTGPDGREVDAAWMLLPPTPEAPGGTGVVELASTSGIELLGRARLPFDAHTIGFGQAIAAALDRGVSRLALGIGSSASTDGGAGMLRALGARFDAADGLRSLASVTTVDVADLRPPPSGGVIVLCDVTNPLLGPAGAAAVFGPQKGLSPDEVPGADAALRHWADVLATALPAADPNAVGAGAAGGTGFALQAWGAHMVSGSAEVAELIGLADAVAAASLIVTGEGSFDAQSAGGKAPAQVAALATAAGVPVALVAGRIAPDADLAGFSATVSLSELAGSAAAALADPARWLRAAGRVLAARNAV
ncbi:glycerate kinase [Microbacterium protaetiae]|uniref:Glycerate kinase n=1 Tax=Microbacterium protaetiae TaxID=2509458 RepID=A0A4P6EA96_9MICO|nr:glycerate kinase [Microbacterium protaetiae]QAY59062.1 glycerate kinase [Microbacterium protaetiae]